MKIDRQFVRVLSSFALFGFVTMVMNFSLPDKGYAQEPNKTDQKRKSLFELAKEQDVEIIAHHHSEGEHSIETLAKSEAIVQGRIIKTTTILEGDSLYTTYTIETQRIIKPFVSGVPIEAYQILEKTPPEPIGAIFQLSRPGGSMTINGHQINEKVAGFDELTQGKNFIFFLCWSGDYKTYMLSGGISGVILVDDDLKILPLAKTDRVKKSNENLLGRAGTFEAFLETLKQSFIDY